MSLCTEDITLYTGENRKEEKTLLRYSYCRTLTKKKREKGKNTHLGTAKSMLIVVNQGSSFRSIQKGF